MIALDNLPCCHTVMLFTHADKGCPGIRQLFSRAILTCAVEHMRTYDDYGYAGNESHAGQIFTCVAALAVANALHTIDTDSLCWW